MAAIVEGRKFYELIRRNKSGDRSSDELRRANGRRYGPGVGKDCLSGSAPLLYWSFGERTRASRAGDGILAIVNF